jgi:glycosyltransferase involved in cell wall biosynthesis
MKVSGFTIVRNAIKFDYPVRESILSVLPLCDEFIVLVGNSDDGTLEMVKSISPKITVCQSTWNDTLREGGRVLAEETNKAFDLVDPKSDWAFYIQADEVLHEEDIPVLQKVMEQHLHNYEVEGLLFNYTHFYGSYSYVGDSRRWYRNEIRVIRNNKQIRSYRDAQGFRLNNRKLKVKKANARIFHYGWVKHPVHQKEKEKSFHRMWHSDEWMKQHVAETNEFDYSQIDLLLAFTGTHPKVMQERISRLNWEFKYDASKKKQSLKNRLLQWIEKKTGKRLFEYKNYEVI